MVRFPYIWTTDRSLNSAVSVSLARAVYSRASILLLDDVLSAGEYYVPKEVLNVR